MREAGYLARLVPKGRCPLRVVRPAVSTPLVRGGRKLRREFPLTVYGGATHRHPHAVARAVACRVARLCVSAHRPTAMTRRKISVDSPFP